MKKFIGFFLTVAVAVGLAYFFLYVNGDAPKNGEGVEISEDFGSKIVYTQDVGQDPAPFRQDCNSRGGEFQECGSICAPDADICAEVCAYTCVGIDDGSSESSGSTSTETTSNSTSSQQQTE